MALIFKFTDKLTGAERTVIRSSCGAFANEFPPSCNTVTETRDVDMVGRIEARIDELQIEVERIRRVKSDALRDGDGMTYKISGIRHDQTLDKIYTLKDLINL